MSENMQKPLADYMQKPVICQSTCICFNNKNVREQPKLFVCPPAPFSMAKTFPVPLFVGVKLDLPPPPPILELPSL